MALWQSMAKEGSRKEEQEQSKGRRRGKGERMYQTSQEPGGRTFYVCLKRIFILLSGDGMSCSYLLSPTSLNVSFSTIVFLLIFCLDVSTDIVGH